MVLVRGETRDWGLRLFRSKLTGAYKLLYTVAIHKGNLCKQYNKYYGEGYSCMHFHCFSLKFILRHCERLSPVTMQHIYPLFPTNVKIDEVYFGAFSVT